MTADTMPDPEDKMIGRKVGGYTIARRIGQGGMGIVYEAKHERINQRAAVKVLHQELSADEKVLHRFFNEAKAISVAQHSSIVKIFDFGQLDDGIAYIMMEFLEGEPLLSRLERAQKEGTGLPILLVIELGRQIAAALAMIHEKGILHRDLKPENIFIVPDPVAPLGERVKLLDFGIAKFLEGPVRKTTVGMILGTPLYMSPEQCEGSEDLDSKVDVYALGVMFFEMIAGYLPFRADTPSALMRQHMFKEPPPLTEVVTDLPLELADMVQQMLAKKPTQRPTMAEIVERLEALSPHTSGQKQNPLMLASMSSSAKRKPISIPSVSGPADPLARTMAENDPGPRLSSDKRPTSPAAPTSPAEPALPSGPVLRTASVAVVRKRFPLYIIGALLAVIALGALATRLRPPAFPANSAGVASPSVPSVPTSGKAPDSALPSPTATNPSATNPSATPSDTEPEPGPELEDGPDGHKGGHGKKLKPRPGASGKKPSLHSDEHKAKNQPHEDGDVWR
jgi:serine/threonine-protein kinase